jgi:hypothetical protein
MNFWQARFSFEDFQTSDDAIGSESEFQTYGRNGIQIAECLSP